MPEHPHFDDDAIFNLETHHEKSDVNVRALLQFFVAFVIFSFATYFVVRVMFVYFKGSEKQASTDAVPLTMMVKPAGAAIPAEPRLQPFQNKMQKGPEIPPNRNTPVTDMEDMRKGENAALTSYGWIDRQKGIVRLPIDDAKKLALQRGFPVVPQTTPPAAAAPVSPQQQMDASGGQKTSGGAQQ